MSLGQIIESYTVHSEHKRVIELSNGDVVVTRMKIYKDDRSNEFHPSWEHSVQMYVDTNPQASISFLVSYWENKIISAKSSADFLLQQDY